MGKFGWLLKVARAKIAQIGLFPFAILMAGKVIERIRHPRCKCADLCRSYVTGAHGVEIGGPSRIFSGAGRIPLYDVAAKIDGLNFSSETVWASELGEDRPFVFGKKVLGRQFVREASHFPDIDTAAFDFVLSSHVIEHLANPLRGLREWGRVLREGGVLVLVVPHKDATFDHRRPVTKFEHILEDFSSDMGEDDKTHIPEVLELHDFDRDLWVDNREEFRARCEDNMRNRCIHHHVFDTELAIRMVDQAGFWILAVEPAPANNIVILCGKPNAGKQVDNAGQWDAGAEWRKASPFPTDRGNGAMIASDN